MNIYKSFRGFEVERAQGSYRNLNRSTQFLPGVKINTRVVASKTNSYQSVCGDQSRHQKPGEIKIIGILDVMMEGMFVVEHLEQRTDTNWQYPHTPVSSLRWAPGRRNTRLRL